MPIWCTWACKSFDLKCARFSGTHVLFCEKEKNNIRFASLQLNRCINKKTTMNSKYYREHQRSCDFSIMLTYLMTSKLSYLHMNCETFNCLHQSKLGFFIQGPSNISEGTFCFSQKSSTQMLGSIKNVLLQVDTAQFLKFKQRYLPGSKERWNHFIQVSLFEVQLSYLSKYKQTISLSEVSDWCHSQE